jgi:hypothetical protein
MATTAKWTTPITIETVMGADLNSLATAAGEVAGGASPTNLTADSLMWADLELAVTFGVAPTANSIVECYLVRQIDSTNYEDYTRGASAVGPSNGFAGAFMLRAVTSAQRVILPMVALPPTDFRILLINRSGQTMAASGNTLKMRRYSEQAV